MSYAASAALAALAVVAGLFVISAFNSEAEPLRTGAAIKNAIGNFITFFLLFWFLGMLWSLPFRSIAHTFAAVHSTRPTLTFSLAGALSGLSGVIVALWIGSALAGVTPLLSWVMYCPLIAASGAVGGVVYGLLQRPLSG
jgi:hypothetical protein